MANYYADSSVLVKRHVKELGSAWVRNLMSAPNQHSFFTAQITEVEVLSALNRRLREKAINQLRYARLKGIFQHLCSSHYLLLSFSAPVLAEAKALLERHPLRAYDAVQLASALVLWRQIQSRGALTFLSADDRLLVAAQAEGLATDNPNHHS